MLFQKFILTFSCEMTIYLSIMTFPALIEVVLQRLQRLEPVFITSPH